jgi:glycosyltransferase involved in cell wall biosynthesis
MTGPTLEFMIPYHGDPAYLHETVESLLAQTDPDWTATVLDDHYPDPSASAWVNGLGDGRLRAVRNERNLGINGNFQQALRLASADYVVMPGGDDRLLPGYVQRVREVIDRTGATIIQPGVQVIDSDGLPCSPLGDRVKARLRPAGHLTVHRGEGVTTSLLQGNWAYFPSLAWRVVAVQPLGFRECYDVVQDLALLIDTLLAGGSLAVDSHVVFEYRRHAGSLSSAEAVSGIRFDEEAAYFRMIAGALETRGWLRARRAARLRLMSRCHAASLVPRVARADLASAVHLARHAISA